MNNFAFRLSQKGLTLIEILVALVVLSIGLIGIALLQINSLKFAHSSYYSSVASSIALDLEERLWVSLGAAGGGCLSDVSDVITDLTAVWTDTDGERVAVPGMTITAANPVFDEAFTAVPVTLALNDARFADGNVTFTFAARVVCFDAADDDEEDEP